jgi:hypothetical protein
MSGADDDTADEAAAPDAAEATDIFVLVVKGGAGGGAGGGGTAGKVVATGFGGGDDGAFSTSTCPWLAEGVVGVHIGLATGEADVGGGKVSDSTAVDDGGIGAMEGGADIDVEVTSDVGAEATSPRLKGRTRLCPGFTYGDCRLFSTIISRIDTP